MRYLWEIFYISTFSVLSMSWHEGVPFTDTFLGHKSLFQVWLKYNITSSHIHVLIIKTTFITNYLFALIYKKCCNYLKLLREGKPFYLQNN